MTGAASPETVDALLLDLLEWVGPGARPYDEVLEAWRTSCPRLPVWEEAHARRFLVRHRAEGAGERISLSAAGTAYLAAHRPQPPAAPMSRSSPVADSNPPGSACGVCQ